MSAAGGGMLVRVDGGRAVALCGTLKSLLVVCVVGLATGHAMVRALAMGEIPLVRREDAVERECRRQCASWLMPQCRPDTMRRGETAFECVSRLAPVLDDCVRRCRSK